MKHLIQSLIMSVAVIGIATPSFADGDREDRGWDRDKKEQSHHSKKDKKHHGKKEEHRHDIPSGKPFKELIMIVEALEERVTALEEENAELKYNLACVSGESDAYNVYFQGCNVHVRNDTGSTDSINGKGNLIIGYNEDDLLSRPDGLNDRSGSHNLIVGPEHTYSSFGGLVAGLNNTVEGIHSTVSGGISNRASGEYSSISAGDFNWASGKYSSISGGGGSYASGDRSSVSGGSGSIASGFYSSISGGRDHSATGVGSWIGGGDDNVTSDELATVVGGSGNHASGNRASILGDRDNVASGRLSTVSGGRNNIASGDFSSVSGGQNIDCSVENGWAAGTTADTCP